MVGVFLSLAGAQTAINEADTVNPWVARLMWADRAIWLMGLAAVSIIVAVWLARSRRDPLARAPLRPNRVLPEHVILLMIAFFAAVVILQRAARLLVTEGDLRLTTGNAAQLLGGIACLLLGARLFEGGLRRGA